MRNWVVCVLIAVATCAVYSSVWRFDFVNFDDADYIYSNPHVRDGLTARSIAWAFTTNDVGNYHPLTWISWLADISLLGVRPAVFHVENVLLHLIDAMLLFLLLKDATGDRWPAAFAAFVFALHPTHVESVAWISERKDVLSTLFLLLAMIFYARFTRGGGWKSYGVMLVCFALSLLSKQMGVTLPVVLLLMDLWPLKRASLAPNVPAAATPASPKLSTFGPGRRRRRRYGSSRAVLFLEKVPLLMLSIAASAAIFAVQHAAGEVATTQVLPMSVRLQSVPVAYVRYICETLWPVNLCAFYPYQAGYPVGEIAGCTLLLLAITMICLRFRRTSPWLIVGWSWFVVMLLPVIGLVQVGGAAVADRYLYVPSVGLSIMLAWTVKRWAERSRMIRGAAAGGGVAMLVALGISAHRQAAYWENTRTLFTRALTTINNGSFAHMQLGRLYLTEHDVPSARHEYELAAQLAPADFTPEYNLGNLSMDHPAEAIAHFQRALKLQPHDARVENNLAIAWIHLGRNDLAASAFHAAIADDPRFVDAHLNFAKLLESIGSFDAAAAEYQTVLKIDSVNATAKAGSERMKAKGH